MGLNLNSAVVECLKENQGKKHTAREIAEWIFATYPNECEEKRQKSKQDLSKDSELLQQIIAEVGANRPVIEKRFPSIRTTETRPRLYYFSTATEDAEVKEAEGSQTKITSAGDATLKKLYEADLYPLLASYLHTQHNILPKRIDEKTASNKWGTNGNRWLFPDMVGMEDFGADWDSEIQLCVKKYGDKRVRLWSFEVKQLLNRSNVRESWFQTVSNSSWANFGYLVAGEIATGVIKELRMLSAAHGIGVIRLDVDDPAESEILIPAKERIDIDWDSCNRLVEENKDFKSFIELVREFHQTDKAKKSDWDIPNV